MLINGLLFIRGISLQISFFFLSSRLFLNSQFQSTPWYPLKNISVPLLILSLAYFMIHFTNTASTMNEILKDKCP